MTWRLASALFFHLFLPAIHAETLSSSFSPILLFSILCFLLPYLFYVRQFSSLLSHLFFATLPFSVSKYIYIFYAPSTSRYIFETFDFSFLCYTVFVNRINQTLSIATTFVNHFLRNFRNSSSNVFVTPVKLFKLFLHSRFPLKLVSSSFHRIVSRFLVLLFIPLLFHRRARPVPYNQFTLFPRAASFPSLFLAARSVFPSHTRLYACSLARSAISLPTPRPPVTHPVHPPHPYPAERVLE